MPVKSTPQSPINRFFIILSIFFGISFQSFASAGKDVRERTFLINHAPVFYSSTYSFNVIEEVSPGSLLGTVSATDEDGDQLAYSILTGNTNGALTINATTGSITVVKRLNHHTQNRYDLSVKVRDVAGLSNVAFVVINVTEGVIDPGFDSIAWSRVASQPYTVNESQGEVVNGKLYTFGGFDSQKPSTFVPTSRAYMYDPVLNKWTSIAPMPPTNGTPYGGVTHAGFTTDGTDIYFAGGYTSNSAGTGQKFGTKEVWKYIVAETLYVRLPDLPVVIAAGQLEYLSGKLHHIGGTNSARTLDLGDHYVLNLDSLSAGWKKLASLPNPRQHAGSTVYEGKIYYIGGQHGHDEKLTTQKDVHVYDQLTNSWTKVADLPVPAGATGRGHISSSVIVMEKYIIVLAGETVHHTGRTNLVSAYLPATNTWKNLTPLPSNRYSGVAANLKGTMYYTGGSNSAYTFKGLPAIQKVLSVTLINADTDAPIKMLMDGDTISLSALQTSHLNIRANTDPATVGSVVLKLTGPQNNDVTENEAPYSLFGDDGSGDYFSWTPSSGTYTLKATTFSGANATGTEGGSQIITFTVINNAFQSAVLSPVADAFVQNGSYAAVNFGDTSIEIKSSPTSGFTRYAYLKFSTGSVGNVTSAKLRLYGRNRSSSAVINLSAYGVNDDSWLENEINFNNAPVPLTQTLSSAGISGVAQYYDFDVTDFVRSQVAGDKIVSFFLKDPANSDKNLTFNSRESAGNLPQLVIQYTMQSRPAAVKSSKLSDTAISTSQKTVNNPALKLINGLPGAKVYPNPMRRKFTITFAKDYKAIHDLQIVDPVGKTYPLGKSQLSAGASEVKVDISNLSLKPGIYFLKMRYSDKKGTENIKLILE